VFLLVLADRLIDAASRANVVWKQLLSYYEKPNIDPATEEALRSYVDRRKVEIATTMNRES